MLFGDDDDDEDDEDRMSTFIPKKQAPAQILQPQNNQIKEKSAAKMGNLFAMDEEEEDEDEDIFKGKTLPKK